MKITKKNLVCFLCAASLSVVSFFSAVSAETVSEGTQTILPGDVNEDGAVDSTDLAKYKMYLLGSIDSLPLQAGDIDRNGSIDSLDFAALKHLLGIDSGAKIDDWEYSSSSTGEYGYPTSGGGGSITVTSGGGAIYPAPPTSSGSIGLSTGGAKDINNFRENLKNNYFPQYSSLTYEGLFYDYYFDTGKQQETDKLFSPSYSYSVSADPLSGQSEYYLSVGLNSGLKQEDFTRKKLNLTVVLDISGSMSSPFDRYYYDNPASTDQTDINKSKLQIATESIVNMLGHLNKDDRFGMVLFDGSAYLAKPLNLVGGTNMDAIKKHILGLTPQGSTYFEAGYKKATQLYDVIKEYNPDEYENRIIFLTDAMPNVGAISEDSLLKLTEKNAQNKIYTTFIGIGVDFNTDLIDYITKTRGANYYSVHSSQEFKTRMDEEFEYMVTPLVFNLQLNLQSKGFEIEKVYGSPEANESTGQLMKINTLFPSKVSNEETKGGIVLLKLKKISDDTNLTLTTSYEDRNGKVDNDTVSVVFEDKQPDFYQNSGIRKGILLSRYANLVKNWLASEEGKAAPNPPVPLPIVINQNTGIIIPDDNLYLSFLSKWEHQSTPLTVSQEYKDLFTKFIPYFENEMNAIGDSTMSKEVDILKKLSTYN